ncbi:hypothetical protein ACIQC9_02825 [Brevundimonas sp. NPDC092305]|uniref:hypothetical protein n=1 Tax=Brevundimonas sp. NPDC092305 TaxID=3363957 RepID=UPI00382D5D80
MRRWLWMTGGLVVWAIQFSALYALSSLADVTADAAGPHWRLAGLLLSVACALVCIALLWRAARKRQRTFIDDIAALSALIGVIATLWQGLPTVIGF